MNWSKILTVLTTFYKIIKYLLLRKKGQAVFADIRLNHISIEIPPESENGIPEEIIIKDIRKINFNENNKTITFVNDLGTFTFNVEKIQSLSLSDVSLYSK